MVDLTPVDYLGGLGGLAGIPNFTQMLGNSQALRTSELQQQAAQLKIQQALTEQERQQLFQRDVISLGDNPTPQGIAALIRRYPQFAEQLKAAHDIQDEAKRTSDFRLQSQVYSAAANGRYDLAAQMLEDYARADAASGGAPDPMDQAIIQALKSGDPAEQKRALSMIGLAVAAINPKKFDETYKALTGGGESYTLAPGSMRFDSSNRLVASAPFAPEYRNVSPGDTVVEIDRNASGGTPSGASASAALNNPGAIRFDPANNWQGQVGQENGFVRFDTPENGQRAHRKLIANQIKAGFDTPIAWANRYAPAGDGNNDPQAYARAVADGLGIGVNDKIPLTAVPKMADISARVEGMGASGGSGGARVVAQVAPKPGYRILTPAEVSRIKGLSPERAYQISPEGQITPIGGQDTKSGRAIPQTAVDKLSKRIDARDSLGRSLSTFRNDFGGNTITGSLENWLQGKFGTGTPGQRDWWANFYETDNQIRNDLFGSALTATEQAAYERTTITPSMQPSEIRENLKRRNTIIRKALERQKKVLLANKYEPEAVEALFSDDPLAERAPAQEVGGFRIVAVRPK
ncbi:hypothetical protein [Rhizorhabdus histidinilytica]|uniref:hypothetical protein n=1 Tax=Rhizorhabdus histidinilytica TaxID=439228 RepID=UPI0032200239